MKLPEAIRKLSRSDRCLQSILLLFMVFFYGVILHKVGVHGPLNRVFNSMLDHLVHGQFDVDPNIIDGEGFLRNGRLYAYWGITCALIRLPLLLFHRLDLDVTAWSCLAAVCLAGMMKVRTVLFLRRRCGPAPASQEVFAVMLAYIVLGGAEVGYLKYSVYQEVVFWAITFAAIFVYFAIQGLVDGRFTVITLSWMAVAAGLATLTRVSTGMGLCAAFGLLLIVLLTEEFCARRAVFTRRFLVPLALLAMFLIIVGTVNYFRWGNPATFADFPRYMSLRPDEILQLHRYGSFNLARVPFGLSYYFLPIPALVGVNGLLQNTQTRLIWAAELPPSTFFLTDLLPIAFVAFLAMALRAALPIFPRSLRSTNLMLPSTGVFSSAQALALAAGLAVPCGLMLTAIFMSYRYRMEFYPEIDLLAFLGLYSTVSNPALLARFRRFRGWMLAAATISIVSAFAALFLYALSSFGLSQRDLGYGLVHYYRQNAGHLLNHLLHTHAWR